MVLTAGQTAAFFENPAQMGIPHATVVQMGLEGMATVDSLGDFDSDGLDTLFLNLKKPGGMVPGPLVNGQPGPMVPSPSFRLPAESANRLRVMSSLVKYYRIVGRDLTAAIVQWNTVGRHFKEAWASHVKDPKDSPEVPKVSGRLSVMQWSTSFKVFLSGVLGKRQAPLLYVIRAEVDVPAVPPPLAANRPYSNVYGSIAEEMIARTSHDHILFSDDNKLVYQFIEQAVRGTSYAASIKPFERRFDGRGAWLALTSQYAGLDKYKAELEKQEQVLYTRVWKGQSNFSLGQFIQQHRNAFVSMQACAEQIDFQLPNDTTRVRLLLDAIKTSDAELQAGMARVRDDKDPNGMAHEFEAAAAYLVQYDPVAKKRNSSGAKRGAGLISGVMAEEEESHVAAASASPTKPSIGKTGVHFRYYKLHEFKKLSQDQKDELIAWRKKNPYKGDSKKKQKSEKKKVAALVSKQVKSQLEKALGAGQETKESSQEAFIMSIVKKAMAQQIQSSSVGSVTFAEPVATEAKQPQSILNSIVGKAKNGKI